MKAKSILFHITLLFYVIDGNKPLVQRYILKFIASFLVLIAEWFFHKTTYYHLFQGHNEM